MAQAPDAPTEGESQPTDVPAHEGSEQFERLESERRREVPALLGTAEIPDPEEQTDIEELAETVDAADAQSPPPAPPCDPLPVVEAAVNATAGFDMALLLESLQESRTATHAIAARIDTLAEKVDALSQQMSKVSSDQAELTAEIQGATAQSGSKNSHSNTFLIAATSLFALLTLVDTAQMYMVVSLRNDRQHQAATESAVLKNMTGFSRRMAAYGANLTPPPVKPETQGHALEEPAHANPPTANGTGGGNESISPHDTPPLERLNKLRNGLAEKKLIRKENGDWFVYGKKSEENITDVEVIKALNLAYEKIGRSLIPPVPLPAHNALCILKADGKGGTQIVMTKDFLP